MQILTMVSWMFLGFCKNVMHEKSPASLIEKHKHTSLVWNLWCTPCLQWTSLLHIQWNTKMLWWFNTKCTKGLQQINTTTLEEEVLLLLVRTSRQTSMPTPNNMSKALLSSCTLKKHFIHHMKTCPFGEHKQGTGDNAYTKGKTWQEQKNQRKLLLANYCNSCAKQADNEDDFLTTQLFGWSRSCLLARSTTIVNATWQHPNKVYGLGWHNRDCWCSAIWPITSNAKMFSNELSWSPPPFFFLCTNSCPFYKIEIWLFFSRKKTLTHTKITLCFLRSLQGSRKIFANFIMHKWRAQKIS